MRRKEAEGAAAGVEDVHYGFAEVPRCPGWCSCCCVCSGQGGVLEESKRQGEKDKGKEKEKERKRTRWSSAVYAKRRSGASAFCQSSDHH